MCEVTAQVILMSRRRGIPGPAGVGRSCVRVTGILRSPLPVRVPGAAPPVGGRASLRPSARRGPPPVPAGLFGL